MLFADRAAPCFYALRADVLTVDYWDQALGKRLSVKAELRLLSVERLLFRTCALFSGFILVLSLTLFVFWYGASFHDRFRCGRESSSTGCSSGRIG